MSTFVRVILCASLFWWICIAQAVNNGTIECKETTTCSGRGTCINDDGIFLFCFCDDGWITHPIPNSTSIDNGTAIYCNYEQKEQLIAFLLSLFLGYFAVGRFYCELWLTAGLKLALTVGMPCLICCVTCIFGVSIMGNKSSRSSSGVCGAAVAGCGTCFTIIVSLAIFGWALADVILFALNKIDDGNGVELASW